jgi:dihydroneopterin aldolase
MQQIAVRGIRVHGRHGANPGEQDIPQPFDIDVVLDVDVTPATTSDALADTLDYGALHAEIVRIVQTTSYQLLERLSTDILDALTLDTRVQRAQVTIGKPRLLAGATPSVAFSRSRA